MPNRNTPQVGKIYTLGYIFTELVLSSDPSFMFTHEDKDGMIRHEHMDAGDLSLVPGLFATEWEYRSSARIIGPVFRYVGKIENLLACVDITTTADPKTGVVDDLWWAIPKGFPVSDKK